MSGQLPNDFDDRPPLWRRYLRFWRSNPEADVDEEVRFHLESAVAEYVARGMSPGTARAEAARRFGDVAAISRTLQTLSHQRERNVQRAEWFDTVRQDLRVALRGLRRSPGFTLVVTLTLALGIGANGAIFSVVYAVLLKPLPYAHADRLLNLRERNGPRDATGMFVTYGNYGSWVEQARSFEALGASLGYGGMTLTGTGDPQPLRVARASASYWKALYIPPALGRYFGQEEDRPGAPPVVVLSYALWHTTFGGDSSVVGRSILLSGVPYTVVGVASPEYALTPQVSAAWVPLSLTPEMLAEHRDHELTVVGLVREGVSPRAAIAELARIETALARQYPKGYFDGEIVAAPYLDKIVGPVHRLLVVLFGAVGLVLLIACLNIANLLLARAAMRQKEIAVRSALGAGRGRIVAQLLAESLVLAVAGAAAGLVVAAAGIRFLVSSGPQDVPRLHQASLDAPVLLFTVLLAVICGIVFGLLPALRASRLDLQSTLREGARTDAGAGRHRLRAALVVFQVSMALVLLVAAGLLVRSAMLLQRVPPGFDPRNLLVAGVGLPASRYPNDTLVAAKLEQILGAVSALPGVESGAMVSRIPIGGWGADCGARREGSTQGDGSAVGANVRSASAGFFSTLRVPLLRGRMFNAADQMGSEPVAMINRRLARQLFGDADPIGRRIVGCGPASSVVVGITDDIHADGLAQDIRDEVYLPSTQLVQSGMMLLVRGSVPVMTLTPAIRRVVRAADPELPVAGLSTMESIIDRTLATPRFQSTLLALLGVTGLVLAIVGIYGVIAFLVVQRTPEIGIRIALGASRTRVLGMVVRQGLALALLGIVIGVVASLAVTRVLANLLFGVGTHDPLTFVVVALLLAAVSVVASFIPARRATRVDPLAAMRAT